MSFNARKELVLSVALRYHKANRTAKGKILDEFTAATGYHRKYAILLLRQLKPETPKEQPAKNAPERSITTKRFKTPWFRSGTLRIESAVNGWCLIWAN